MDNIAGCGYYLTIYNPSIPTPINMRGHKILYRDLFPPTKADIVSVLGRDKGYTVKYIPLSEGVPEGKGLYLTVYPKSFPNTDSIH